VVIAGGSEGIAACLARRLAKAGLNLVLIARTPEPLENLASEVRGMGVQVRPLATDLTQSDILERVREVTDDVDVGLLVFNAGNPTGVRAGSLGPFIEKTLDKAIWPIKLSAISLTTLSHHFAIKMAPRRRGGLLFIGSIGGFFGTANVSTYCGAKAFVHVFTEALWTEMRAHDIDVLCYSVGLTETPSKQRSMVAIPPGVISADPDDIARQSLYDLSNDKGPIQVPPHEYPRVQQLFWLPRRKLAELEGNSVKIRK
jgi:short-subunit dehydrogenase